MWGTAEADPYFGTFTPLVFCYFPFVVLVSCGLVLVLRASARASVVFVRLGAILPNWGIVVTFMTFWLRLQRCSLFTPKILPFVEPLLSHVAQGGL